MALMLADLNDYIAPGLECIRPPPAPPKTIPDPAAPLSVFLDDAAPLPEPALQQQLLSLADCLSCSGCVTSAEALFVSMHSHVPVIARLALPNRPPTVLTIARQSLAALASRAHVDLYTAARKIHWFAYTHLGAVRVLDAAAFQSTVLREYATELTARLAAAGPYAVHAAHQSHVPSILSSSSSSSSSSTVVSRSAGADRRRARMRATKNLKPEPPPHGLPLFVSTCPGVVCYIEKTHPHLVPLLCPVVTPLAAAGHAVAHIIPFTQQKHQQQNQQQLMEDRPFHVAIMPCHDMKLNAVRPDVATLVDNVVTTSEMEMLISHYCPGMDFAGLPQCPEAELDPSFGLFGTDLSSATKSPKKLKVFPGSGSGGYANHMVAHVQATLGHASHVVTCARQLGSGDFVDIEVYRDHLQRPSGEGVEKKGEISPDNLEKNRPVFRAARVYGFKSIQNLLRRLRMHEDASAPLYHFVEIMACPSGCLNGGGQGAPSPLNLPFSEPAAGGSWVADIARVYDQFADCGAAPSENVLNEFNLPPTERSSLRTEFHGIIDTLVALQQPALSLATKW